MLSGTFRFDRNVLINDLIEQLVKIPMTHLCRQNIAYTEGNGFNILSESIHIQISIAPVSDVSVFDTWGMLLVHLLPCSGGHQGRCYMR